MTNNEFIERRANLMSRLINALRYNCKYVAAARYREMTKLYAAYMECDMDIAHNMVMRDVPTQELKKSLKRIV